MDEFCLCGSCVCVCGQEFVMQLAVAGGDSNCCMGRSNNVYDTCLCVCGRDFVMQLGVAGGDSICCV